MKRFEISVGDKAYNVEVERFDGKRALVKVDGRPYDVKVGKSPAAEAKPAPAAARIRQGRPAAGPEPSRVSVASASSEGRVAAPLPGLILEVMVEIGDQVAAGTPVLKMEAMKMENVIPSPMAGTIKTIEVKAGENVSTDQTLMTIEQA